MAGKKDGVVVAVISGLTRNQSARLSGEIMRAKDKCAPLGRGTIAAGLKENVGNLLQNGQKYIGGK